MRVTWGDIVIANPPGDFGKPRPCLVIQSDVFPYLTSVCICVLTSATRDDVPLLRIDILPSQANGLREASQVCIDKVITVPKSKVAQTIGKAEPEVMAQVKSALSVFLGLG